MNGNGGELASFLQKLSEDRELQQAYMSDPKGTMRQAGLSDEAIETILSRDLEKIKAVLDHDLGGIHYVMFMVLTQPKL